MNHPGLVRLVLGNLVAWLFVLLFMPWYPVCYAAGRVMDRRML